MLAGAVFGPGCTCADTGARNARFVCTDDGQCAEGFFCDPSGECLLLGGAMGGGEGGGGAAGGAGGGGGGGGGGGELDSGIDAGVDGGFLQLVITSAPQTLSIGACSAPVTFEVRDGPTATRVPVSTNLSLAATPGKVISFFSGPGCTDAGPLTLAADASTGSFSFLGTDGGAFTLDLTAPLVAGTAQQALITYAPLASLAFVTAPQTVRAGDCSGAITVELRDATNAPTKANAPVILTLGATPLPGVLFFSNSTCGLAVTDVTVPTGASRTTFYASRATGLDYTLSATTGGFSVMGAHTILPMVRVGSCVIGDLDGGAACPVVPPVLSLTDSFLVYQVSSASNVAGAVAVLCELDGLANISCKRGQVDQDAQINWQVAEVKGATVRKATTFCDGGLSVPLSSAAPLTTSFVLTANENNGNTIDDSDFNIGKLNAAGTAVDFEFGSICSGPQSMLAQVVTLPNILVKRAVTSIAAASPERLIADPPPPQAAVLLAQWRAPTGVPGICDRAVRPELVGNSLSFSRGNASASASCTALGLTPLVYEKVDFRATALVQQLAVTMAAGASNAGVALTAVDRTRTLVFTGGQGSMGQSLGEGTHLGSTNTTDYLGDVSITLTLGGNGYQSTQLMTRRASTLGSSRWSAYVVELIP